MSAVNKPETKQMSKQEAKKVAEEFVLQHKNSFKTGEGGVTEQEVRAAVNKVARALVALSPPRRKLST